MSQSIEESLTDNAAGPKRAKGDSAEMEQHSLPDQIAADRYLAARNATRRRGLANLFKKLVPPGAE